MTGCCVITGFPFTHGQQFGSRTDRPDFFRDHHKQKQSFLPLFTDWMEFEKAYKRNDWGCVVFTMADAIRATGGDNIVINPLTENLTLDREDMKAVIEIYKNLKNVVKILDIAFHIVYDSTGGWKWKKSLNRSVV